MFYLFFLTLTFPLSGSLRLLHVDFCGEHPRSSIFDPLFDAPCEVLLGGFLETRGLFNLILLLRSDYATCLGRGELASFDCSDTALDVEANSSCNEVLNFLRTISSFIDGSLRITKLSE
jgi:hypothetical protein